jgi:transcriptional regulator with XRE-family HTH domain
MVGLMTKKSSNRIDKYIGSRIRVRRDTLGISQRKLAHAVGVSFQQVQRYEHGTDRI